MVFQFNFGGDDIPNEGGQDGAPVVDNGAASFLESDTPIVGSPANDPKKYDLASILPRTKISYTRDTNEPGALPRRDLFDVKYQLMAQDKELTETDHILLGDTNEDIRPSLYEGGVKVWECSFDMIHVLEQQKQKYVDSKRPLAVLEMGCGAAIPCAYLLRNAVRERSTDMRFCLSDFNLSVLTLVTGPNLLLAWLDGRNRLEADVGEVVITDQLVQEFQYDLDQQSIAVEFISGAWSSQFVKLAGPSQFDLVLASETVYSPDTISIFTDSLIHSLQPTGVGLVGAKKVYFGVGGGIPEFVSALNQRRIAHDTVFDDTQGVGRAVLSVTRNN